MEMHRKAYRQWLLSFLAVLAAILAVFLLLCLYLVSSMRANVLQVSEDMATFMRQSVDSRLDELQKNTVLFELSTTNSKLKRSNRNLNYVPAEVHQFCDQLRNYRISSTLVENVMFYYPKLGQVAGNIGFYDLSAYNSLMTIIHNQPFDVAVIVENRTPGTSFVLNPEVKNQLYYIRDMYYEGTAVGHILIQINVSELVRASSSFRSEHSTTADFGIVLGDEAVAFTGDFQPEALAKLVVDPASGESKGRLEYANMLAYVLPSAYPGLQYIAGNRQSDLFRPIYVATAVCAIGLLLCLVFGIAVTMKISRRNVRPLEGLVRKLSTSSAGEATEAGHQNEYQFISGRIDQLVSEKHRNEEQLTQRQAQIGSLFLNIVLGGELQEEADVVDTAHRNQVQLEKPCYQVATIAAREDLPFSCAEEAETYLQAMGMAALITQRGGKIVILLNLDQRLHGRQGRELLSGLLQRLFPGKKAVAALGESYDSQVDIFTSYSESLAALPQLEDADPHGVRCYSKQVRRANDRQKQGLAAMEDFTRALYTGWYDQALECLPPLLQDYLGGDSSADGTKRRMTALKNLLLDELDKLKQRGRRAPGGISAEKIRGAETPADLEPLIQTLLTSLAAPATSPSEEGPVCERARELILRELTNPMLGLYMISNQLGVSNTYLSTRFKTEFGVGLVHYINQMRVEQAKELIVSTDLSIREIALSMGFTSDINFIRVFKKYENKTPASLRKAKREPDERKTS